ncbi:Hypothetical protein NTJ_15897 [Nesidiocoris tenuis]|uniref:Uncharacterized protein n=1 Tax=Nesidiocoris tenuis TaxID=355587 RepID=A0ABN7BFC4_9HEMI|nr:Hypothetical protein NTJ_15897 [Nesidiocoris tenuis]
MSLRPGAYQGQSTELPSTDSVHRPSTQTRDTGQLQSMKMTSPSAVNSFGANCCNSKPPLIRRRCLENGRPAYLRWFITFANRTIPVLVCPGNCEDS